MRWPSKSSRLVSKCLSFSVQPNYFWRNDLKILYSLFHKISKLFLKRGLEKTLFFSFHHFYKSAFASTKYFQKQSWKKLFLNKICLDPGLTKSECAINNHEYSSKFFLDLPITTGCNKKMAPLKIGYNKTEHAVHSYAAGKGWIHCNVKNAEQCWE